MSEIAAAVDLTLLVCTFNRSRDLREMLETALAQETDGTCTYEVVVVDNNSSDDTRAVVESFTARGHRNLRYFFEGTQGKSHALNTGLAAARGGIYTIADDDFILPPEWVKRIYEGFRAHPDASFVGGKVLPLWQGDAPEWLGVEQWSAIALADYGDEEFYTDESHQVCLLACSFRRSDVEAVGGYRSGLSVSNGLIGGVEDLEILQRLWKAGRKGIYLPGLAFHHKVPRNRLTKTYYRRWHVGHGRFYATMHDADFERSAARLFDVPAHMYKQAVAAALDWVACKVRGRSREAFMHETRLCFFSGFFRQRRREYLEGGERRTFAEIASFVRALFASRRAGVVPPAHIGRNGRPPL
jgi:glucosyl-dolichyl phosphate glucuronosyltransferase